MATVHHPWAPYPPGCSTSLELTFSHLSAPVRRRDLGVVLWLLAVAVGLVAAFSVSSTYSWRLRGRRGPSARLDRN